MSGVIFLRAQNRKVAKYFGIKKGIFLSTFKRYVILTRGFLMLCANGPVTQMISELLTIQDFVCDQRKVSCKENFLGMQDNKKGLTEFIPQLLKCEDNVEQITVNDIHLIDKAGDIRNYWESLLKLNLMNLILFSFF